VSDQVKDKDSGTLARQPLQSADTTQISTIPAWTVDQATSLFMVVIGEGPISQESKRSCCRMWCAPVQVRDHDLPGAGGSSAFT